MSPSWASEGACQKCEKPTSYKAAAEANEAMWPPTLVSLFARTTIAIAFQRMYECSLISMSGSPG